MSWFQMSLIVQCFPWMNLKCILLSEKKKKSANLKSLRTVLIPTIRHSGEGKTVAICGC